MKCGWQTKKLSDLFRIGSSKRVLKSEWKAEGVPFYRGREVTRLADDGFVDNELFISEKHFAGLSKEYGVPKAGDIVITAIGTIGNSHVVRESDRFYFKDASVLWMKRTAEVSSEFVNLWLKSPAFFDQLDRGNGATVDTLTIQTLQGVEILVPPLAEQQRIVGLLDEAFEGLTTAKASAERNLQNGRALFESQLQSFFTQRGPGWVDKQLGDVCKFQRGLTYAKGDEVDVSGNVVLRATNIDLATNLLNLEELKYISETVVVPHSKKVKKDSLMICTASGSKSHLGKVAYIDKDYGYAFGGFMGMLTPLSGLLPKYLFHLMTSEGYKGFIRALSDGANINNLTFDKLRRFAVPVPPLAEQQGIVGLLDALHRETQRLTGIYQRKLAALEALKKSLLHQAFAGEL